jgi:Flp pilus assembly protein TadD
LLSGEDSILGGSPELPLEEDDDVTRIDTPDPSVLAALRAAASKPLQTEPELESQPQPEPVPGPAVAASDTFELAADELRWGDALGEPRTANLMRVAGAEPEASVDELDWGDESPPPDDTSAALDLDLASSHDELTTTEDTDPGRTDSLLTAPTEIDEEDEEPGDTKMLSTRAFSRASTPRMAVPRVVEPRPAGQPEAHTGTATIQILGHGRAQTLTPTLELGGAPEDGEAGSFMPDSPSGQPVEPDPSGSFSLQFEEPDDGATGPHVPVLTESEELQHRPVVLTSDGSMEQPEVAPVGAGLTSAAIQNYLAHAEAAERRGNLREAVVHYDDLLSHAPHNVDAHLGRGRCLVDLGDYGSAMSDFTRAEDIAPNSPEPLVEMGNLFFARKEYKRAITYYNHAIDLDSSHAMAFSRRGISHYHRRQYAEAHNDLTQASKRDSSIPGLQRYIQMAGRKMNSGR